MPEVIAPELSRIRQWVLERVDEPGSYLRKTSGDWGPSYMPTERIEEALRFTDLAHARTECRGGRGSITDTWGGALRPIEIEVSVHRLSPWDD